MLFFKFIYYVHCPISNESPFPSDYFPRHTMYIKQGLVYSKLIQKAGLSSGSSLPSVALPPYQLVSAPQAYIF